MSEANVNSSSAPDGRKVHPPVATTEHAIEYITNALLHGKMHMKEACKELGWSFPRIRSRALTIAKKMNCVFTKTTRGVYILEPIGAPVSEETIENPAVAVTSDSTLVDNDEPTLDSAEVEAALLGDNDNIPSV